MARTPHTKVGIDSVIFEFQRQGAYVKVSAVHEATGKEVSIVGDAAAGEEMLRRLALRKLETMLARDQDAGSSRPKGYPSGWDL